MVSKEAVIIASSKQPSPRSSILFEKDEINSDWISFSGSAFNASSSLSQIVRYNIATCSGPLLHEHSKRIDILLRRIWLRRGSRTSAEVSLAPRPGPHSRQNLPWVHGHSTPTSDMQWLSEKLTKAAAAWAWTRGLSLSSSTCSSLGRTTSWYLVWNVGLKSVAICHCEYRSNS